MAFTTLMLFQLFNAFNCRSTSRSAFDGFFDNKWLIAAVALSLFANVLVIYVPFLQAAFHTVALSAFDWLIATGVASTLLVGMELVKWVLRMQAARCLCREADEHSDCEQRRANRETIGGEDACHRHDAGDGFRRQGGRATRIRQARAHGRSS